MLLTEKASLAETVDPNIRPGREAGDICHAACLDAGRTDCYCSFPSNHVGNVHGCSGDFTHPAHVWYIAGVEIPAKVPIDTEVQCPNCNYIYHTKDARSITTSKVALPGVMVKAPEIA